MTAAAPAVKAKEGSEGKLSKALAVLVVFPRTCFKAKLISGRDGLIGDLAGEGFAYGELEGVSLSPQAGLIIRELTGVSAICDNADTEDDERQTGPFQQVKAIVGALSGAMVEGETSGMRAEESTVRVEDHKEAMVDGEAEKRRGGEEDRRRGRRRPWLRRREDADGEGLSFRSPWLTSPEDKPSPLH